MNALAWFLLAAVAGTGSAASDPAPQSSGAPAIRLWLNSNRTFREGERAQLQVESRDDGYLVVLNYDTEGRLEVLFPLEPRDDNFVQGGRRYEIRSRRDRESFVVGREGEGLIYAAVSADPFSFRDYEAGGTWDYTRFSVGRDSRDAEADITDLLRRMSSDRGFDYDVLAYRVWGYRDYRYTSMWYPRPYGFYDDYWCDYWYRPSLFGCRSWWPGSRWYFSLGFGYFPYRYSYYPYSPYRYGWGYYDPWWYRGYYPRGGYYNARWPVVVGRPRGYTIVRRSPTSGRVARLPGSFSGGSFSGGATSGGRRPDVIDYRPRGSEGRPRPASGDRPSSARPSSSDRGSGAPATRSRPRSRPAEDQAGVGPTVERERSSIATARPVVGEDRARRSRSAEPGDRAVVGPGARTSPGLESRPVDRARPASEPRGEPRRVESSDRPGYRSYELRSAPRSVEPRARPSYEPHGEARRFEAPARPSAESPRAAAPRSEPPRSRAAPPSRPDGPRASASPRASSYGPAGRSAPGGGRTGGRRSRP
jgi:hypothetical protein